MAHLVAGIKLLNNTSHISVICSETVFGYRGLKVQLYFSAAKLTPYLTYTFDEKVNPKKFDGVQVKYKPTTHNLTVICFQKNLQHH